MQDKVFLDTNVLVYTYSATEIDRQRISTSLVENFRIVVSTQVLQEMANVLWKKFHNTYSEIKNTLVECRKYISFIHINGPVTLMNACDIAEKYRFSFYDSLIIAAALESGCTTLYSEDMQHNQVIEGKLKIVNPFV